MFPDLFTCLQFGNIYGHVLKIPNIEYRKGFENNFHYLTSDLQIIQRKPQKSLALQASEFSDLLIESQILIEPPQFTPNLIFSH